MSFTGPAGRVTPSQPQNLSPAGVAGALRSLGPTTPEHVAGQVVASAITHVGRRLRRAAESGSRRKIERAIESFGVVTEAVAELAGREVVLPQVLRLAQALAELTDRAEELAQLRRQAKVEPSPVGSATWAQRHRRRVALTLLELRTTLDQLAGRSASATTGPAILDHVHATESPPGQLLTATPHLTTGPPSRRVAPLSVDELAAAA